MTTETSLPLPDSALVSRSDLRTQLQQLQNRLTPRQRAYLAQLSATGCVQTAADRAGISRKTVGSWRYTHQALKLAESLIRDASADFASHLTLTIAREQAPASVQRLLELRDRNVVTAADAEAARKACETILRTAGFGDVPKVQIGITWEQEVREHWAKPAIEGKAKVT